jgi:UDP-N-acetylmuramoylalanine--D-glutamate ligase
LENICASILVARILKVEFKAINHALTNFKGLEHRLEFVANQRGIQYFNDSFSTTPETAIGAISSFFEPLILILGGSSKNSNFEELGKTIDNAKNLKAVILIGEEAKKIQQVISRTDIPIYTSATNMKQIFEQIHLVAQPGDVVLLSPACASFGMFKNYKDRGEQFKYFVAHA